VPCSVGDVNEDNLLEQRGRAVNGTQRSTPDAHRQNQRSFAIVAVVIGLML